MQQNAAALRLWALNMFFFQQEVVFIINKIECASQTGTLEIRLVSGDFKTSRIQKLYTLKLHHWNGFNFQSSQVC